jgi:hypothetical protein
MTFKKIRWAGLAFLALSSVTHFAQADETPQPPIRLDGLYTYLGIQGGVNFASLSGDGSDLLSSHTGFQAGAQIDIPFTPYFSLMTELRYVQRGASVNLNIGGVSITGNETIHYIEIPILAKLNFQNGSDFTPFIFFGPNFAFRTGVGGSVVVQDGNGNVSSSSASDGDVKAFDFGLDFGAGPQYQVSQTTRIFIDFEYDLGLTNINPDSSSSNQNRVPEINVGFSWAL